MRRLLELTGFVLIAAALYDSVGRAAALAFVGLVVVLAVNLWPGEEAES